MTVTDVHPSNEDLQAFALGTLADAALVVAMEAHVADCPTCQERAADTTCDSLVELVRRVHAQAESHADTLAQASQQPTPPSVSAETVDLTLEQAASAEEGGATTVDLGPQALAQHERYRVVRLLGKGGMGSVYEAEHRVMQRAVALKVINSACTARPGTVERFRREVRAAARLSHPNIVTTYDAEDAGNTLFLVMEYVEGTTLNRLVKQHGPLPVAQACDYVRQAALGLQHAHERGMVHRDVKPENMMLVAEHAAQASGSGVVKVLDFGLAALREEQGGELTEENAVMGTPDYMAPEQAEDARTADIRADVYSLGCTLYYLLTASAPYPAPTAMLKILAHRNNPLPSIRQARPEVPLELARVVTRMLAKKPADRYQTPAEVAAALAPFVQAKSPPDRTGNKRGWRVAVASLLLALFLVAAVVVYRIQTDQGELVITTESDDVEVIVKQGGKFVEIVDTKTNKRIRLRSGVYELELKGAPPGLKLDISKATLMRGDVVLANIERVAKSEADANSKREAKGKVAPVAKPAPEKIDDDRTYRTDGLPVRAVAVSPDGRLIAAAGGLWRAESGWGNGTDLDVRLLDRASGKELRRFKGPTGWASWVTFSPDGKRVAAAVPDDQCAYVWDVDSGKLLHTLRGFHAKPPVGAAGAVTTVAFFPDGKRLLTMSWDNTIRVWDADSGREVRQLGTAPGVATEWHAVAFLPGGKEAVVGGWARLVVLDLETDKVVRTFDWPKGRMTSVALSPDGKRLLTTGGDGTDGCVRLWDVATGKQERVFDKSTETWGGVGVAFLPDGRRFLMAHDKELRLVDADTGAVLETFRGHVGLVMAVALVPKGPYAVSASHDQTVRLWRLPDPPLSAMKFKNSLGMEFALVPKGKSWLRGENGKEGTKEVNMPQDFYLGVYEVTQEEWQKVMGKNPSHFSRDGASRAAVNNITDDELKCFPVENITWREAKAFVKLVNEKLDKDAREAGWEYRLPTEQQWEYACRGGPMTDKAESAFDYYFEKPSKTMSKDQANFSDTGLQRTNKVGSYPANKLGLYDMHGNVWEWCEDPFDSKGGSDRVSRGGCWCSNAEFCRAAIRTRNAPWIIHEGNNPSDRNYFLGFRVARVPSTSKAADPAAKTVLKTWRFDAPGTRVEPAHIYNTRFSPDSRFFVAGGDDNRLRIYDVQTARQIQEPYEGWMQAAVFSADNKRVLSARTDNSVRLWDVATGKELRKFTGHTAGVLSLDLSTDDKWAVSVGYDKTLRLWEVATGKEVHKYEGNSQWVQGRFSPDGLKILACGGDKTIRLWDVETREEVRKFEGHTEEVWSASFLPGGKQMLSIALDRTARLWDVDDGKELKKFAIPQFVVHGKPQLAGVSEAMAVSPDGKRLLIGSNSPPMMRLIELASGREICHIELERAPRGASFSPDGRFATCGSFRGFVYLFQLPATP